MSIAAASPKEPIERSPEQRAEGATRTPLTALCNPAGRRRDVDTEKRTIDHARAQNRGTEVERGFSKSTAGKTLGVAAIFD